MKSIKFILQAIIIFSNLSVNAQEQRNIWYFGDKAGIDFNSGSAVPLLDGQMDAFEGCASISDSTGNLLFYTNGGPFNSFTGGVWNSNHSLMPNGNLDSVNACNSAAQAALIVPDPKNQYKYYIFTTDCQENSMAGGLRYHKVDMSLNAGLGDVVEKNIPLASAVTESLLGAIHANGSDYWVVVSELNSNNYFSYLITANGIQSPVISTIGPGTPQQVGQMCISPDGSKIGFAATWYSYLFDFDNSTGILSNFISLEVPSFGCAFSPNSQIFYASKLTSPNSIYQFDLNASDIPSSVTIVGNSTSNTGNLQLGPDGKIYTGKQSSTLGVINNPDSLGVECDFSASGFDLGGNTSNYGLPNFVNHFIDNWCDNYNTIDVLSASPYSSPSGDYLWTSTGVYYDTIPNTQHCDSILTINLTIDNTTSVDNQTKEDLIKIYPNPFENEFTVNLGISDHFNAIIIFNSIGELIKTIGVNKSQSTCSISLETELPGIYFIRITSEYEQYLFKVMKK